LTWVARGPLQLDGTKAWPVPATLADTDAAENVFAPQTTFHDREALTVM